MKRTILTAHDENAMDILRTISEPVDDVSEVSELISDMKKYLLSNADTTLGVSAPQIGVNKMVFAMKDSRNTKEIVICVNPEITKIYNTKVGFYRESCLSEPESKVVTRRYKMLKVSYLDEKGKRVKRMLRDTEAVVFQHELDHLYGSLLSDHSVMNESEDI